MRDPAEALEALNKVLNKYWDVTGDNASDFRKAFKLALAARKPEHVDKVAAMAEKKRLELANTLKNLNTLPAFIDQAQDAINKSLKTLKTAKDNYG